MLVKIGRIIAIAMFFTGMIALPVAAATTFGISGNVTLSGVAFKRGHRKG